MSFPTAKHQLQNSRASLCWCGVFGLGVLLTVWSNVSAVATPVVAILRNGDRITGELVAQETNQVIIATGWAGTLTLPLSALGGLQTTTGDKLIPAAVADKSPVSAETSAENVATTKPPEAKPAAKPAAQAALTKAPPKRLISNVQLGSNFAFGAKDQNLVYARLKMTYAQPYEQNPKKFFRALMDVAGDYGENENVRSANRVTGSLKTDFDVGERSYFYNVISSGYDEARKIDFQYAVGPGYGFHAIKQPKFELNLESGVDYQEQQRSAGNDTSSAYLRLSDDFIWKIGSRLTISKKFEYFLNGEDIQQFRLRLDAGIGYRLVDGLSLNLNVLDLYDTDPAPGVNQNELQIRTTIGLTF